MNSSEKTGEILDNNECGIFGTLSQVNAQNLTRNKAIPIALRNEIKEGPAQIISCVSGNNTTYYNIQIQKVYRQNANSTKSMVIKITDERLINYTGGIVQGMSGSPIIQNGKLVGAVTHVLVNDPTRGYGIFIESMLKHMVIGNHQTLWDKTEDIIKMRGIAASNIK
jgi:stage IV sporulation protein B